MRHLLHAWQANHDVQYIMDPYACAMYVVAYMSKSQKGMSQLLDQACKEAKEGNMHLRDSVKHIGNKFLNSVEISAQEAAYLVLQLPITKCTREVIFINTSHPDERPFLLKEQAILKELPSESTDIACGNIISRYSQRPKQLVNWCLADFASKINVTYPHQFPNDPFAENTEDNIFEADASDDDVHNDSAMISDTIDITLKNGITYKERKNPRIIRYVRYSKRTDLENYCRERLMLFVPWRKEENDLLGSFENYYDHYVALKDLIETKAQQYEHNAEAIDAAQEIAETGHGDFANVAPSNVQQEDDDGNIEPMESETYSFFNPERPNIQKEINIQADVGLPPRSESVGSDILAGRIPDVEYKKLISSLNEKQQKTLRHILKWIKTKPQPLNLFVTGGAGVGKSVLIKAIYQSLHRYLCSIHGQDPENIRILISAATGKAAYNVKGVTIHQAFSILPNQSHKNLTSEKLNSLQVKYRDLKVVIIDEISLVGNTMLQSTNARLQEIKKNTKPFGGVHMLVLGDLYQLRPVKDKWIFQNLNDNYGPLATNL